MWESVGGALFPRFAGLTLMEAQKDMFAGLPVEAAASKGRRRVVVAESGA